jgi:hypothetical protein
VVPLPTARSQHAAVAVGSDMYVLGGVVDRAATASVLKFDSHGIWSLVAPMPEVGYAMATAVVGTDIYVFGGRLYQFFCFKFQFFVKN